MIKSATFNDYFTYMTLQNGGKSVELADRWLLENFLLSDDQDISKMGFRELAKIIGKFKSENASVQFHNGMVLDGFKIEFVDGPSTLYFEMQRKCSQNLAEGLRFGILNSYTANGEHLAKVASNLSFQAAEILSKDMMSFFS